MKYVKLLIVFAIAVLCLAASYLLTPTTNDIPYTVLDDSSIESHITKSYLDNGNLIIDIYNPNCEIVKVEPATIEHHVTVGMDSIKIFNYTDQYFEIIVGDMGDIYAFGSYNINKKATINADKYIHSIPVSMMNASRYNYNVTSKTMTDTTGLHYKVFDDGVVSINNFYKVAFALRGDVNGKTHTYTSMDFTWTWHKEQNGDDYVFWAENNDTKLVWKQYYKYYADPNIPMKVEHYIENNLVDITNAQMFYLITVSGNDTIRYNESIYRVRDIKPLHIKRNLTGTDASINFNDEFDFKFNDIIADGFEINEFYIGSGRVLNRPAIDIVAIGFTKNNGNFPKGTHIVVDPTFSTDDIKAISICPLDVDKFVIAWATDSGNRTFAIYDTNGTLEVGPINAAVDAGSILNAGISVAAFNDSSFVIGWYDITNQNASFRVYDSSGTALTAIIDADTDMGYDYSVSVSTFNETTFVIAWTDGTDDDASFRVYDSSGTALTAIIDADTAIGSGSRAISVSTFNETTFVIGWRDDATDDTSFRVYDSSGTALTAIIDADTINCRSVFVSTFDDSVFVIGWHRDVGEQAILFRIYDSSGTALTGITYVAEDASGSYSVSTAVINDSAFVIGWINDTSDNASFRVYDSSGTALTAIIDAGSSSSYPAVQCVASQQTATGIKICDDNFIMGWELTSANSWVAYHPNGTAWDGICAVVGEPYIPPDPINLQHTTSTGWVNYTWSAGSGNVTNSYNVLHNGSWTNGSANTYMNNHVGEGNWSNITVYAWNNSGAGTLSAGSVSDQNTAPYAFNIDSYAPATPLEKIEEETQYFNITVSDNCQCRWYINGSLKQTNTTQQTDHNYTNTSLEIGYFNFSAVVNTTDDATDMQTWWVTVNSIATYIPPPPVLSNTTGGDFWANFTWTPGSGNTTNSYNVSYNDVWDNGTIITHRNESVSGGGWHNITVCAWNSSGVGTLSNTCVEDSIEAPSYKPPEPINLANTTGNFWVNHTWQAGSGNVTDGYNVSVNDVWYNRSYPWYNDTYSPHGWQNISVWAWNNTAQGMMSD